LAVALCFEAETFLVSVNLAFRGDFGSKSHCLWSCLGVARKQRHRFVAHLANPKYLVHTLGSGL